MREKNEKCCDADNLIRINSPRGQRQNAKNQGEVRIEGRPETMKERRLRFRQRRKSQIETK